MTLSDIVQEHTVGDQIARDPVITYLIGSNDLILEAKGGDFAKADYDALVGTPLLYHVHGIGSAAFIKGVLDKARKRGIVRVPYRCDTNNRKRSWIMEASVIDNGRVVIQHYLIADEPRKSRWSFRTATTSFLAAVPRCSVCNQIFLDNHWQDPELLGEAASDDQKVVEVVYEICSLCEQLAR